MKRWVAMLAVLLAAIVVHAVPEQRKGSIDGTVINEQGKPVQGATVKAYPLDRGLGAVVPSAKTDEAGYYTIRHLWWGQFWVYGRKEDEGYPDLGFPLYRGGRPLRQITLDSRHPSATVNLRLGPKAGVLVGNVTDAVTGVPLAPCVEFRLVSEPDNYLRGQGWIQGKYRTLVPSNSDFTMVLWDGLHEPWYYPGTGDKAKRTALRLEPAQEEMLDIRMQPKSAPIEAPAASAPDEGCSPVP